jgi:hypothetical protein
MRKLSSTALLQWKGVEQNCGAPPIAGLEIAENAMTLCFTPKSTMAIHQLSDPLKAATCLGWLIIKLFTKTSL